MSQIFPLPIYFFASQLMSSLESTISAQYILVKYSRPST